jgi:two-component system nitrogen regulation sensor histidine kinase NtrY
VRHVGDIGRMVDEFSAFARMPQPVMKREDIGRILREALVLHRNAHPEIAWATEIPERGPVASCDRRLLGQALTNLLKNAADAVAMAPHPQASAQIGRIELRVEVEEVGGEAAAREAGREAGGREAGGREGGREIVISVADDGIGLPAQDRSRLTEPYVTHKPKGTGLGLAIVKKIMEDHGGRVVLEDRLPRADWPGAGTVARLCFGLELRSRQIPATGSGQVAAGQVAAGQVAAGHGLSEPPIGSLMDEVRDAG